MLKWLLIAAGGGLGSVLRYLISGWGQRLIQTPFPLGTLTVNLIGCLLIGFLNALFARVLIREEYRIALLAGVLGGFTTFSSFGWETFALLNDAAYWRAVLNIMASVLLGLVCVWLGYRIGEQIIGVA
jgi:CrcB protein